MTTETQQAADDGGVAASGDTLTVTDNRTGKQYEIPIEDNTIRATELRNIKTHDDDFGLMTYDPAYMATASCRSAITFIDGEKGILEYRGYPIEQLAEKSTYLEVAYLLIHGELPTDEAAGGVGPGDHDPHVRARERQGVHAGLPLRRPPDGDAAGVRRRAFDLLSGGGGDQGPRGSLHPDHPPAGQDADAGRVLLPPQPRHALRLSGQRPELSGQLPLDDLQGRRAQVRARPAARARPRRAVHPARRPRAELLHQRGAQRRLLPGRPLLGGSGRRGRALRPAARWGQRGGPADAQADRDQGEHSRLHRGRQERR